MSEIDSEAVKDLAGIWYARAERLQAMLTRRNAACVEVLDWAYAQDEERRPAWVERLERVMEERP